MSQALHEIDVAPALSRSRAGIAQVGREIRAASEQIGFYLIVGHGVPAELRARVFDANARFQAMSLSLLKFVGQASLVDDAMLPS